jgi:cytochrome c oxidase cbb3-type subunit 3
MSQAEYERMFEHAHDGIREFDNPLPGWWTGIFIASVLFSVAYVAWFHVGTGPSIHESYDAQVAAYYEEQLRRLGITQADDLTIVRLMNDQGMMQAMAGMFAGNCSQCHRADGGGNIGPNLADEAWKNVKRPQDIFRVITAGVPGTAMAGWERRLRQPQRILLAAYVASLRGSTPADAKAPEGTPIPPWPSLEELERAVAAAAPAPAVEPR